MKTAFIIHGAMSNPQANWFPWLKTELQKLGYKAYIPAFPTPEKQTPENWDKAFAPFLEKVTEESIFIGHSLGPLFILRVLQSLHLEVKACFFVSAFVSPIGNAKFDTLNKSFLDQDFEWPLIKHHCREFVLLHAEDDPYVSPDLAEEFNSHLHGEMIRLETGGHLNAESGVTQFPVLLEKIKQLAQTPND